MSWFQQFTFVMRSNLTAIRDKVEAPERMLHQLICDMEEELNSVKQSVAAAIADEIQLGKEVESIRSEIGEWEGRAESALQKGKETLAKQALDQKMRLEERLQSIEQVYESQCSQTAKLQTSYRDLEDKIRQARHKRTLLIARLAQAQSRQKINQAIDSAESQSAFAQFHRLEEKVNREESLGQAYDRLDGKDPEADELTAQFDAEERKEKLEAEFEELKRRLQTPAS
ncbi:Phage shock protein A [Thalassoglobus neptunius]|uniref:Phage shock protein A n=1 Tax=Thalassoglobus neptunius TaxID=1938619 RepID=A0A5C5W8K9_9PLAN|nr:PspA/IM30 family protein [Thalassoglobus neptunius]TWT46369.1 Phage shock protein A [Thalassoglobus neptunius]